MFALFTGVQTFALPIWQRLTSAARAGANPVAILWERLRPRAFSGSRCPDVAAEAAPTRSSWRERTRRRPALGCALASRIQAAMTAAHVTIFLFPCVSWLLLALPMPAAAADPCPLLCPQAGCPVGGTRLSPSVYGRASGRA